MVRNSVYHDLPFTESNVALLKINTSSVRDSNLQVSYTSTYMIFPVLLGYA